VESPVTYLCFDVPGRPYPQGSKKAWAYTGKDGRIRAMLQESSHKGLRGYRRDLTHGARLACAQWQEEECPREPLPVIPFPSGTPVSLIVTFVFTRPKSHYRTGKFAHLVRDDAPDSPVSRSTGDLSKLVRAVEDALTDAGVWEDDSQVAQLSAMSVYGAEARTSITVESVR
jgi:Holliday junction resolvase RusA-like endonuclease